MIVSKIEGLAGLVKRMAEATARKQKAFQRGCLKAARMVQRESQKIVPVDTGALKNSAFTRQVGKGSLSETYVGYTAAYAIYVHERTDLQHKPGKTAKFLERPIRRLKKAIRAVIEAEVRKVR